MAEVVVVGVAVQLSGLVRGETEEGQWMLMATLQRSLSLLNFKRRAISYTGQTIVPVG